MADGCALRKQPHASGMFTVSVAETAVIQAAFDQHDDLSVAIGVRRVFPGITDNVAARACVRAVVGQRSPHVTPLRQP